LGVRDRARLVQIEPQYPESSFRNIARAKTVELPADERIRSLGSEDIPGLSPAEIETEAQRCINCGCPAIGPSDLAIALVALEATIVTTKRTLPAREFFTATAASSTVLETDELIREVRIPKPPKGARQAYAKFTLRKPIDFALVSVASVITCKNGVCSDARITLGAVAPSPVRAKTAEAALRGKPIDEAAATNAAELALAGARPLSMNSYKVKIARTLVKRAILEVSK